MKLLGSREDVSIFEITDQELLMLKSGLAETITAWNQGFDSRTGFELEEFKAMNLVLKDLIDKIVSKY